MRGLERDTKKSMPHASSVRARVTILGAMSATIALATTSTAAFHAYQTGTVSSTRQSTSNEATGSTQVRSEVMVPPEPATTEYHESVRTSSDGQSETRQYSATTQEENGATSSQNHTITTDIDGNTAVDVSLDTNSSTSGSSSSSSSINLDVRSSTQVRSSGP